MGAVSWIERYLAKTFFVNGAEFPQRGNVNITGAGITGTDNEDDDELEIAIPAATVPAGSSNDIQKNSGGAFASSSLTDDGTTVTSGLPFAVVTGSAPATPTGKIEIYSESDVPKIVEPSGLVTLLSRPAMCLAADFTTSSTTAVTTPLTFTIGANDVWLVRFMGTWNVASGVAGAKIAIAGPGSALIEGGIFAESAALTSDSTARISALGTLSIAFNTGTVVEPVHGFFRIKGDGVTGGPVTFEVASGAAVLLTLKKGFGIVAERVVEV